MIVDPARLREFAGARGHEGPGQRGLPLDAFAKDRPSLRSGD